MELPSRAVSRRIVQGFLVSLSSQCMLLSKGFSSSHGLPKACLSMQSPRKGNSGVSSEVEPTVRKTLPTVNVLETQETAIGSCEREMKITAPEVSWSPVSYSEWQGWASAAIPDCL